MCPKSAVAATHTKMRRDMRIPRVERKDMEERSLIHKLGRQMRTATTVRS